jgi:hypothetical protein
MLKREQKTRDVVTTTSQIASVAMLQAQLAEVESELTTATNVQDYANQTSIWSYNTMALSDALIHRSDHTMLIKRLEQLSLDADDVKALVDALVRHLRDSKRELTKQLGSHVNDEQMKVERERAVKKATANAEAMVKSQPTQAQTKVKQKTKTELVAEVKKQVASKKKAA